MSLSEERFPVIQRGQLRKQVADIVNNLAAEPIGSRGRRVVLLYGNGGVGKTFFLRRLAQELPETLWLGPFDIDDAQFWLLSNLEAQVARQLDPEGRHFKRYFDYQSQTEGLERASSTEVLLARSRQSTAVFFECYRESMAAASKVPVLALDTLEAIRGLGLQLQLCEWLSGLKGSVLVLASRPPVEGQSDSLASDLTRYGHIHARLDLERFTDEEAGHYLRASDFAAALTPEQQATIVSLADGYPLRLAMALNYLRAQGLPRELTGAARTADDLRQTRDEFLRDLLLLYRGGDFWSDTIKSLGVIRRRVDVHVWRGLLADRPLPQGTASWDDAWQQLVELPWIRVRANQRYVTLHDAVAEALAQRLIPQEDHDHAWRRELWRRAADIYDGLVEQQAPRFADESKSAGFQDAVRQTVEAVDHYLLRSTAFYYRMLSDPAEGVKRFIELYDGYASSRYRLLELLWLEMQHFLLGEETYDPLDDIIRPEMRRFQEWYKGRPDAQYEVGTRINRYLIHRGRPSGALERIEQLLADDRFGPAQRYELLIQQANACERIPNRVPQREQALKRALSLVQATPSLEDKLGQVRMEFGGYYRQVGHWLRSAIAYREALEVAPRKDRARSVRIKAQYAFVLGLRGRYEEASDMAENAWRLLQKHAPDDAFAINALTIRAQIARYQQRYALAVRFAEQAAVLALDKGQAGERSTALSQQAISLFQATEIMAIAGNDDASAPVPGFADQNAMLEEAKRLAEEAVRLARGSNLRQLASILNRAGRIHWDDWTAAFAYFQEGIERGAEMADTWMHLANLVEYATLAYDAWRRSGEAAYRQRIDNIAPQIEGALQALEPKAFLALRGRWEVVQAHCKLREGVAVTSAESKREQLLNGALALYKTGYLNIARGYPASRTSRSLHERAEPLRQLIVKLPPEVFEDWLEQLDATWRSLGKDDKDHTAPLTTLLGELDELST